MSPKHLPSQLSSLSEGQTNVDLLKNQDLSANSICRTTAFSFNNAEHAESIFALKEHGFGYSRIGHPTQAQLESQLANLEGGIQALAVASGQAAVAYSVLTICQAGDEIIAANNLYGGTHTLFTETFPQFGIKPHLVDPNDPRQIQSAINQKTRLIFVETLSNPGLRFTDLEGVSNVAHRNNIPLIVDSTFTPPTLFRPLNHGADIVIHSLSKWISGHGSIIGGAIIDGGTFNWQNPNYPMLSQPNLSYHGIRFAKDVTEAAPSGYLNCMRTVTLRNTGACISADTAWIALQGIETLGLRMEKHCDNAQKIAEFLFSHPKVAWVKYPGLPSDQNHTIARKYLEFGFGGVVSFGVAGGKEEAFRFINHLKRHTIIANVGETRSLVIHPWSTTHSQLSEKGRENSGVYPNMIRLSVGLERHQEIIADLQQGLESI